MQVCPQGLAGKKAAAIPFAGESSRALLALGSNQPRGTISGMTIVNLPECPHCGANIALLTKLETVTVIGNNPTHNAIVACTNCGSLMVRIGGAAGALGWITHVPQGPHLVD